jgi:hypothetical protein
MDPSTECQCFKFIEQVTNALDYRDETRHLIGWLKEDSTNSSSHDSNSKRSCHCTPRRTTSLMILNALRDACRPFMEANATTAKQSVFPISEPAINSKISSYADDFPPLGNTTAPGKKQLSHDLTNIQGKAAHKKRVRPQIIHSSTLVPSARLGNLVSVKSSDEPLQLPTRIVTPKKAPNTMNSISQANMTATQTPPSKASRKVVQEEPLTPASKAFLQETVDDLKRNQALTNLIDVYVTLIKCCLVPSTTRELFLIVSILNASAWPNSLLPTSAFSTILSSPTRCNYFGAQALAKLSVLIQNIGPPLLKQLIQCPNFQAQLPELATEYQDMLHCHSAKPATPQSIVAMHQTVLLSLPFDEQMDIRHNFKTVLEQAAYKNREETRDRFLSNLRTFLTARGKGFDNARAKSVGDRVKTEARTTIDLLLDANVSWFCNIFCQLLLQIGLVPLEESDKELLHLASQEKLSKLHQRFSDTKHQTNATRRVLRAEATKKETKSTATEEEAHQRFSGHQEFFFLFIRYADSYRTGMRLLGTLIERLRNLQRKLASSPDESNLLRNVSELKMLGKFIGLLAFSPNWGAGSSTASSDGLAQLACYQLFPETVIRQAMNDGDIVVTVPWLVECLFMAKWDDTAQSSLSITRTLTLLQQLQRRAWQKDSHTPCNNLFVAFCVERLLNELFHVSNVMPSVDFDGLITDRAPDQSCLDQTDHPELLSSDKDVEELLLLVSRLDPTNFSPLKSPGASRKVRPSRINKPLLRENGFSLESLTEASTDAVQVKLVQAFFHKHHDMKAVCELVQKQLLTDPMLNIGHECIRPLLKEHDSETKSHSKLIDDVVNASRANLMANMTDRATKVLQLLLPAKDEQTIDIAASLLVKHCVDRLEQTLGSIVSTEIDRVQNSSKQLFPAQASPSSDGGSQSNWGLAVCALQKLSELSSLLDDNEPNVSKVLQFLDTAHQAILGLPQSMTSAPPDSELRSFYQSVLVLDARLSHQFLLCCLDSSAEMNAIDRWKALSSFLDLAVAVKKFSQRGLHSLTEHLASTEKLGVLLHLGLAAEEKVERIVTLLCALVKQRMIKVSIVEGALLSVVVDNPRGGELLKSLLASDAKRLSEGATMKNLLAAIEPRTA